MTVFLPTVSDDADEVHAELRAWLDQLRRRDRGACNCSGRLALASLQGRLFSSAEPIALDESVELVSAPDPLAEVREAARTCLAWAGAGIAFREMAVSYRQAELYRPLVEAVFAEAGIPVYLDDGPSLAERPLGRRVLALLDLVDSPLPRREVMAFLTDGRMPKETREQFGGAPAARWDSVSRRAGVVEGLEQWRSRLTLLREREAAAAAEEGAPEWLERRVADCDSLLAFIERLGRDLAACPASRQLDRAACLASLPSRQTTSPEPRTWSATSTSSPSSTTLVPEIERARFLDVVRAEVKALKAGDLDEGQQGAFGRRGVNVLDVNQLRNLRFRAVAVLGLTERSFPPPPRQDPLLLDDERERLNAGRRLHAAAAGTRRRPGAAAVRARRARGARAALPLHPPRRGGGRARCSFPRPSSVAAAAALAGRRVSVDEIRALPFVRHVPAGRVGADTLERALTTRRARPNAARARPRRSDAQCSSGSSRARSGPTQLRRARWANRTLTAFDGV